MWRNREEIFEDGQYLTERIGQEAAAFIARQREQPFFLYTAFNAVHFPMHAPQKYLERFPDLPPERRMYGAMLATADDMVGGIVAALERTGQRERTLIFLLGDNGATTERRAGLNQEFATAGRNTPFRGYKVSAFDGGMHVPALVNWPGHIPGCRRIVPIMMTADILPTVAQLAGVNYRTTARSMGATSGPCSPRTPLRLTSMLPGRKARNWPFAKESGSWF